MLPPIGRRSQAAKAGKKAARTGRAALDGSGHRLLQVLIDLVEEAGGRQPLLVGADEEGEVLRHEAGFDGVDADLLERVGEALELGDRKSTRLNSSHVKNSYAVFCLKKNKLPQAK